MCIRDSPGAVVYDAVAASKARNADVLLVDTAGRLHNLSLIHISIGLFNQPKKVYIDIAAWQTLPQRQMASGIAETIKHACLGSADMFEFIEDNLDDIYLSLIHI